MTKAAELAKMGEVLTNSQIGGRRNIVINGAMQVAQRGTSETGMGAADGYFTVDRFAMAFSGTAGRLTMTQEDITDLSGFPHALKLACTTADTSIAAGEFALLQHKFEGQDVQQLKKNTSDAEQFTISFYVKGNANATYTLEVKDNTNGRNNSQNFNVTTSWNRVSLTFAADTAGSSLINNDNSLEFFFQIWLHAGSTYNGGTFASNTWIDQVQNKRSDSSSTSFFDSTDRTFFITGVQMEVGSQATPFEHRSFGEELALCQRYYYRRLTDTSSQYLCDAFTTSDTQIVALVQFPVEMRAAPTQAGESLEDAVHRHDAGSNAFDSFSGIGGTPSKFGGVVFLTTSGLSANKSGYIRQHDGPIGLNFDAEL